MRILARHLQPPSPEHSSRLPRPPYLAGAAVASAAETVGTADQAAGSCRTIARSPGPSAAGVEGPPSVACRWRLLPVLCACVLNLLVLQGHQSPWIATPLRTARYPHHFCRDAASDWAHPLGARTSPGEAASPLLTSTLRVQCASGMCLDATVVPRHHCVCFFLSFLRKKEMSKEIKSSPFLCTRDSLSAADKASGSGVVALQVAVGLEELVSALGCDGL